MTNNVRIRIDQLVIRGYPRAEHDAIAQGLCDELQRLVTARGIQAHSNQSVAQVRERIDTPPTSRPNVVGRCAAKATFRSIGGVE